MLSKLTLNSLLPLYPGFAVLCLLVALPSLLPCIMLRYLSYAAVRCPVLVRHAVFVALCCAVLHRLYCAAVLLLCLITAMPVLCCTVLCWAGYVVLG